MSVLKSFAVVCLLFVMTPVFAKPARLAQSDATSSDDNSTEGLQKLVWKMIAAQKQGGPASPGAVSAVTDSFE
jgi:hypothetical protein